jgi:mono/diheme cytochrome c family protein
MKTSIKTGLLLAVLLSSAFIKQGKTPPEGRSIYERNCVLCHGSDGTKGLLGAKNLQQSKLSDSEYLLVVSNGRKIMPAWKKRLTGEEIKEVVKYIKTIKVNP